MSTILDSLSKESAYEHGKLIRRSGLQGVTLPNRRLSGAAFAVATGILLSRIAGLIRDRVFAYYLGNSIAAGAFKAALRIPNVLQNLFGEGVLSASFIPVYAKLRAEGKEHEAVQLAGAVGTLLALIVTIIAALGTLAAPQLTQVLVPGFTGEGRELTVQLVQIMFPGTALLVLSAWCLGILNSHRRFFLPYVAPVCWNVAIIGALLLGGYLRSSDANGQMALARDVAWGTVFGCLLQLLVQLPLALKLTRGLRPTLTLRHPAVVSVMRNFVPIVTSRGVVQISAYIDGMLASFLGESIVAALAYAQQLYLLPVSLFGMSIAAAELPAMSAVTGGVSEVRAQLRTKMEAGLARVSYFVIPSVLALSCLGDVVVATIFQTGQFKQTDVDLVWIILAGSAVGLLASTQGRLCATAFYALREPRVPLKFAVVRVGITALGGYLLVFPVRELYGYSAALAAAALTASSGIAGWVEFVLLNRALTQRIGSYRLGRALRVQLWSVGAVAAAAGFCCKLALPSMPPVLTGIVVLGVFGGVYLGATMLAGIGEGPSLIKLLVKRFGLGR